MSVNPDIDKICNGCNAENVYALHDSDDDIIVAKLMENEYKTKFLEVMIRDGDYNFMSAWVPLHELDGLLKNLTNCIMDVREKESRDKIEAALNE